MDKFLGHAPFHAREINNKIVNKKGADGNKCEMIKIINDVL